MTDHPIVPPPELIQEWENKYELHMPEWIIRHVAYEAAKWGADQELEACCDHLRDHQWGFVQRPDGAKIHRAVDLEQARRPKPQTLNSIAMQMLGTIERDGHYIPEITDTIRRALEALPDD